jgi:Uma2 family endonuclease
LTLAKPAALANKGKVSSMVEVIVSPKREDLIKALSLPYTLRLYGVSEALFDELADEDTRAELIDGVMVVHSPATWEHDDVSDFLRTLMRCYAGARKLGKVSGPDSLVHLATCRRFAPDFFYVQQARVPRRLPKQFEGSPDLVGEVLSPSNRDLDLEDKRPAYRQARVGEVWFVDMEERQVIVDRRRSKRYTETIVTEGKLDSAVLQGFWLDVAWLWAAPLPSEMDCLREILQEV